MLGMEQTRQAAQGEALASTRETEENGKVKRHLKIDGQAKITQALLEIDLKHTRATQGTRKGYPYHTVTPHRQPRPRQFDKDVPASVLADVQSWQCAY